VYGIKHDLTSGVPGTWVFFLHVIDRVAVGAAMGWEQEQCLRLALGAMDVADDQVRVELHLPWLLQRLAESIRAAIQTRGRILLENKPRD
jgi:hypothetical protein